MAQLVIREASRNDVSAIIDFQMKMAMETENIVLDETILYQGLLELFNDQAKGQYYVAEMDQQIVGCLMITFEWSEWRSGIVFWIQSVYISLPFRGKGVFRKLYEHVRQIAQSDPGIRGIRLYVDRSNKDAQQVYHHLGMNGDHYQVYEWMKEKGKQ